MQLGHALSSSDGRAGGKKYQQHKHRTNTQGRSPGGSGGAKAGEDLSKPKPAGVRTKSQKERARRKRKQLKRQQLLEQLAQEQQAGSNQPARCDSATQVETGNLEPAPCSSCGLPSQVVPSSTQGSSDATLGKDVRHLLRENAKTVKKVKKLQEEYKRLEGITGRALLQQQTHFRILLTDVYSRTGVVVPPGLPPSAEEIRDSGLEPHNLPYFPTCLASFVRPEDQGASRDAQMDVDTSSSAIHQSRSHAEDVAPSLAQVMGQVDRHISLLDHPAPLPGAGDSG